jgi:hypothetical protein
MSAATDYLELQALKYYLTADSVTARPTSWTIGLYTSAPSDSAAGTEVSGGSYARQSIAFTVSATSGTTTAVNSATVTFPTATASWGTVGWVTIFDNLGNRLFWGAVSVSKAITTGDTFQIAASNLSIELQ